MFKEIYVPNEAVKLSFENGVRLSIKREDLLHPDISGNKFRKLKYNFICARELKQETILTFGGAYSNHIAATAAAAREFGFKSIGIIRGEELKDKFLENPTLRKAHQNGMLFKFVTRQEYRSKTTAAFVEQLKNEFGAFYLIPEGGTNDLAIKGCQEILKKEDAAFDYICSAVGTGGTLAGLINSSGIQQRIIGFPALKGDFLTELVSGLVEKKNWELISDYHFGGYAKTTRELLDFLSSFYEQTNILLDPIYTGKMIFGIIDLINQDYFPAESKILAIHTGGLQGWNENFESKLVMV